MERKARVGRDSMSKAQRGVVSWPWGWVRVQVIALGLVIGAMFIAPNWRTAAAIGLMLAAFGVEVSVRSRQVGPYGGLVAGVVVTRELFVEDVKGRTRAWLGVENSYGDETGARLVLYDTEGEGRLSLRLVEEGFEFDEESEAEPTSTEAKAGEIERNLEPAIVMFDKKAKVIWRAP